MIYGGVTRKVKFYCKKGLVVFVSWFTRNASFEGGKGEVQRHRSHAVFFILIRGLT